jgi:outer membrane cobalamin receptor
LSEADSLAPLKPFETASTILSTRDSLNVIQRTKIRWGDYGYLGDLLWEIPGAFVRDLGSVGQPSQLTLRGLGWHEVAVLVDGRPVNEPLTGTANLNLFPIQGIKKIEYQTGVRAFLYGFNGTGGTLNIATEDFYINRPYSRIRYSEGGYSFLSTDGIFSQNLTRRINFSAGFQRRTLEGRFPNSNYDAWNLRVKLRYIPSNHVNLVVSEVYNRTEVGLNGGVNLMNTPPAYVFDELQATVASTDSYEKVHRHDLTATLGLRWLDDSTVVSRATAYYSHNLREYRDEENRPDPNGIFIQSDHRTSWYGLKLSQEFQKWGHEIRLGAEIQQRKDTESQNIGVRDETAASLTGEVELKVGPIKPAIFGRYDRYRGDSFGSYGADANWAVLPWLSVFGGYSASYRTPTIQELYWQGEGLTSDVREEESHELLEAGILAHLYDMLEFRAAYFHRRIADVIVSEYQGGEMLGVFPQGVLQNDPERTITGFDGRLALKAGPVLARGTWTLLTQPANYPWERIYPEFFISGEIAYRQLLFQDHLDLRVGLRGKFFTSNFGEQFNPETMIYVQNTRAELNQQGSVDLLLVGRIGRAYIHVILENVTGEQYMLSPFYPMPPRKIRFGIEWEFLD